MRSLKNFAGLLGALSSLAYFGGLLAFFVSDSGELAAMKSLLGLDSGLVGAQALGLGPTLIGLGALTLIFALMLVARIRRLIPRRNPPPGGLDSAPRGPAAGDGGSNADAMIARYLAKRSAQLVPMRDPVARATAPREQRPGFGRKRG